MSQPLDQGNARTCQVFSVRALLLLGFMMLLLGNQSVRAASPLAGTNIGNQASATYTDASGVQRTVTSNVVTTIVQQVYSLTVAAPNAKYATAGSPVSFPHSVTNTGNGTDTFDLTTSLSGAFSFTNVAIYPDLDGNGIADPGTSPITKTTPLAPGGTYPFVVVATVPASATSGSTGTLTVQATSEGGGASVFQNNADTAQVTSNAVINVNKSMSASSGLPGSGPYTVTLTYTNSGNTPASNLVLTDNLPNGFVYVNGSGRWDNSGNTPLTDAADTGVDPTGISYAYDPVTNKVTTTIASIASQVSTSLRFQVTIKSPYQAGIVNNQVAFSYNDGSGTTRNGVSNIIPFTVLKQIALTFTGDSTPSAPQGATIMFSNVLTNNGNAPDTFNITLGTSTYPVGTSFLLYQSDGVTPLLDTNGDGIPDTGVVAAGASYTVKVKVILPTGTAGGGAYTLNKIATSVNDPTKTSTAIDTLTTITGSTVDLTNNNPLNPNGTPVVDGQGVGPETSAVETNAVNPGMPTSFSLYINNTSGVPDTYSLQASTDKTFATLTLPAGFTVVFKNDAGTVITNTGNAAAGGSVHVTAVITSSNNTAAGPSDIFFRAFSPTTSASDRIHDAVSINIVRSITITPNNTGQVYPGNSVVYTHTITNTGNVKEGDGAGLHSSTTLTMADALSGFTSVVYWDQNNNGVLDGTDPLVNDLSAVGGLNPGQSVTLFVKVYAPAGSAVGAIDTCSLTASTTQGTYAVAAPADFVSKDATSVIAGQVMMVKEQALANADGSIVGSYSTTTLTTGALPGAYIRYRIKLTNTGTADATNIVVSDNTSSFTTYFDPNGALSGTGKAAFTTDGTTFTAATAPVSGSAGLVTANIGTLAPGQVAYLYFQVKINP